MKIHYFDHATGAYRGESVADPDPRNDTRWLIPGFVAPEAPPAGEASRCTAPTTARRHRFMSRISRPTRCA